MKIKFLQVILSLWVALILTSCAAGQWAMPIDQSLEGMRAAITGQAGTWVYSNAAEPGKYILGWPTGEKYAFALVDDAKLAFQDIRDFCAMKCNWKTAADFLMWAESKGWASVPAATLSPALYSRIGTLAYLISIGKFPMGGVWILPFVIPNDPLRLINPEIKA